MVYKLLFASRAYESPNTEGGFVHLKDLAARAASDDMLEPVFLSHGRGDDATGIRMAGGFSGTGWGRRASLQFVMGLVTMNSRVDLVHTAHVPTASNSRILNFICRAGRRRGVRYVQTVTALPPRLYPALFWGDAITCLNACDTERVSRFHGAVRTISPIPGPARLATRATIPEEFARKLASRTVVCFPIEMSRLAPSLSLADLCSGLLGRFDDIHIVFACRFGEERLVHRAVASLGDGHDRISVVGQIAWILELFRRSHVVAYPARSLEKKFNPPLVVLEAACLGAVVVVSSGVNLSAGPRGCRLFPVESETAGPWLDAIGTALNVGRPAGVPTGDFERSYQQYRSLYLELLEAQ